jgi:hypothetical protein
MWLIPAGAAASAAVKIMGLGVGTWTVWLPVVDAFRTFVSRQPPTIRTILMRAVLC